MKTFSIRIEEDLFDKVEAARGEKARTDFLREVILGYFATKASSDLNGARTTSEPDKEHKEDIGESARELIIELELKDKIIESKDQTIKTLEHEVGFLVQEHTRVTGQLDRLLLPAQEEITKKNWWQFWK